MMKNICFKGSTLSELYFPFFVPPALPVVINILSLRDKDEIIYYKMSKYFYKVFTLGFPDWKYFLKARSNSFYMLLTTFVVLRNLQVVIYVLSLRDKDEIFYSKMRNYFFKLFPLGFPDRKFFLVVWNNSFHMLFSTFVLLRNLPVEKMFYAIGINVK